MGKRIAILQSNYIPWRGYFDIIRKADEFVIFDTAQYTKNDWRNRNRIKTQDGVKWITIPCRHESLHQLIHETRVQNPMWRNSHWNTLQTYYARAKYWKQYRDIFKQTYDGIESPFLSDINRTFIQLICNILDIKTRISSSQEYDLYPGKTEKLIEICHQLNCNIYISGPAAKAYLNEQKMNKAGIEVQWMQYNYPEYPQLFPPYDGNISILDLIFNCGDESIKYFNHET